MASREALETYRKAYRRFRYALKEWQKKRDRYPKGYYEWLGHKNQALGNLRKDLNLSREEITTIENEIDDITG